MKATRPGLTDIKNCPWHPASSRPLISIIGIKFLLTRPLLYALTRTTAVPILPPSIARANPAAAVVHFIRDVYYDRHDERLAAEGLWAKVRVGGDFAASQFVEVQGAEAVEREMRRAPGGGRVAVDKIGEYLVVMSDLTTRRLSGRLELRYEDDDNAAEGLQLQDLAVAIDQLERMPAGRDGSGESDGSLASTIHTSSDIFFHEIGELELMAEVRTEAAALDKNQAEHQAHEHEARRKVVAAACAAQFETFMCAHSSTVPHDAAATRQAERVFCLEGGEGGGGGALNETRQEARRTISEES
ncbi:hypothetical protein B0H13DRAFT_2523972 [Mycena leptocephala]|nr:hypothetical protein B0H13DRAFT_2523972 [Mycena leptocephala]